MADFAYVTSRLGSVKPETLSIAREIFDAADAAGHEIWFMWGMGGGEHGTGNCLDLMIKTPEAGTFVRNYIWDNRARFRLVHVSWAQHITSTRVSPGVIRRMPDRGSATQNHFDHVHVLFAPGAYSAPGGSTPLPPATPKAPPFPLPAGSYFGWKSGGNESVSGYYSYREDLKAWQAQMIKRGWNLGASGADGLFGPRTFEVAKAFQAEKGLRFVDGLIGPETWAAAWEAPVT